MDRHMDRGISGDLFLGAPVFNQRNDHLGEIEDLVIDPANGRISHAVVEVGGILGIGEKKVLVPFNHLRQVNPDYVMYRGTEEQLK
jgi:sporulation protein YlmC with PRC-barrel domain